VARVVINAEGLFVACSVLQGSINVLPRSGIAQPLPSSFDE